MPLCGKSLVCLSFVLLTNNGSSAGSCSVYSGSRLGYHLAVRSAVPLRYRVGPSCWCCRSLDRARAEEELEIEAALVEEIDER